MNAEDKFGSRFFRALIGLGFVVDRPRMDVSRSPLAPVLLPCVGGPGGARVEWGLLSQRTSLCRPVIVSPWKFLSLSASNLLEIYGDTFGVNLFG